MQTKLIANGYNEFIALFDPHSFTKKKKINILFKKIVQDNESKC